jgi:adenylate cyclase
MFQQKPLCTEFRIESEFVNRTSTQYKKGGDIADRKLTSWPGFGIFSFLDASKLPSVDSFACLLRMTFLQSTSVTRSTRKTDQTCVRSRRKCCNKYLAMTELSLSRRFASIYESAPLGKIVFMLRTAATQSILVVTVCELSRIRKMLHRDQFRGVICELFCDLSHIARHLGGETAQTDEDKLMISFGSADAAVAAAVVIHQFAATHPQPLLPEAPYLGLEIRIGTGTVLRENNRLSGDAVQWAMHTAATCTPRRTLLSDTTYQYLSTEKKNWSYLLGCPAAQGDHKMQRMYEFLGDDAGITLAQELANSPTAMKVMDIVHGPVVMTIDADCPMIRIGRLAENDLILSYPRVSRKHAKIENRRGKFVLVDTSTNGTYVTIGDLDTIHVLRDEIPLIGKGTISPGRKAASSSPGAIHFAVR